jgi:hypothetical protein
MLLPEIWLGTSTTTSVNLAWGVKGAPVTFWVIGYDGKTELWENYTTTSGWADVGEPQAGPFLLGGMVTPVPPYTQLNATVTFWGTTS